MTLMKTPVKTALRYGACMALVRTATLLSAMVFSFHTGAAPWKQIGPARLNIAIKNDDADGQGPDSGTVVDIAIDPRGSSDQTIYVATNGGVWKTTDGGKSWFPKTDAMPSLSIGAIALDPGNPSIVYAGTGNPYLGSSGSVNQGGLARGSTFYAVGLYKSSDGGDNWGPVLNPGGIFTGLLVNRIVLPSAGTLLVATDQGLFRSTDAGLNFMRITVGASASSYITDLKVDTANSSIVYAAERGVGIFVSTDGGANFPAAGNLFTPNNGAPTSPGLISIAQSTQPNNQTIYADVEMTVLAGSPPVPTLTVGLFKSSNQGTSWTPITLGSKVIASLLAGYNRVVGVDPQNANYVYFGLRALYLSTDGGATGIYDPSDVNKPQDNRIDFAKVHADQHALAFSPPLHRSGSAPTRVYNGTDGGIATTANPTSGTAADWELLNNGLATMLFFQIDIGRGNAANNAYTYGATQDLGISAHSPDQSGDDWALVVGGDGVAVAVDPLDGNNAIGLNNGNGLAKSYYTSTFTGFPWAQRSNAFPPNSSLAFGVAFDPNGGVAYAMGVALYQSVNNGASFSVIHTFPSQITAMSMGAIDSNTMWVGLADGTVQRTENVLAGANSVWTPLIVRGSPATRFVSGIAMDPSNTGQAVVVYPLQTAGGRVFSTNDKGNNWVDISGNLPNNQQVNAVVIDPNTSPHSIIVATDTGVRVTYDQGAFWQSMGTGLPIVSCTSLALDASARPSLLRVGTYGRSVFELSYDRFYVDWQNFFGPHDGTRDHPFRRVSDALNAPARGGQKVISIQAGDYPESLPPVNQAVIFGSIDGVVTIR